jgi:hypothetical protein
MDPHSELVVTPAAHVLLLKFSQEFEADRSIGLAGLGGLVADMGVDQCPGAHTLCGMLRLPGSMYECELRKGDVASRNIRSTIFHLCRRPSYEALTRWARDERRKSSNRSMLNRGPRRYKPPWMENEDTTRTRTQMNPHVKGIHVFIS